MGVTGAIEALTQHVELDAVPDRRADLVVGDANVDALVGAADVRQVQHLAHLAQPPAGEVFAMLKWKV